MQEAVSQNGSVQEHWLAQMHQTAVLTPQVSAPLPPNLECAEVHKRSVTLLYRAKTKYEVHQGKISSELLPLARLLARCMQ